ncbi:MAG: TatD family hydrolase [Candidatus Zambryskibacteria bacterium]|nr:TatD family hydrolase [Candidatus Zambryskibacteria bacterium]
MPKYFDIHSHLNASQYDTDREEMIARMQESGTHTIIVGTDLESSEKAVELASKYPEIYATIGIHPVEDTTRVFDEPTFSKLATHPKVVAIGECGFDFYHAKKDEDYGRQKELFLTQIDFALKHSKPLMIHARNAYKELLEILESFKGLRGNVHFFAGDWKVAQRLFAIGFTISFTGVITFTHDYDEVIKQAPLDKILSETDAPYVAPVPYRGKRNEPAYVNAVVKRIAEIRGEDFEFVRAALVKNALRMIVYEL